jgi:hypothetical protein
MFNNVASGWFRWLGGVPCFRIYGKARRESAWRVIDLFATHRRDAASRWPRHLWRGTCVTWTASIIAAGWDFAEEVLREQSAEPASREHPVEIAGGGLHDLVHRREAEGRGYLRSSEILAHECGHTGQAMRLGWAYLPVVGALTLFREGPHWWNHWENQASELGQFGGIVDGSVHPELISRFQKGLCKNDRAFR